MYFLDTFKYVKYRYQTAENYLTLTCFHIWYLFPFLNDSKGKSSKKDKFKSNASNKPSYSIGKL